MVGLTTEQTKVIKRIKDKELTLIPVTGSKSVCWSHFYKVKDPNTDEFLDCIYALVVKQFTVLNQEARQLRIKTLIMCFKLQ